MDRELKLPDITPAQIVAVVGAAIAVAVAFGAPIPKEAQDAITQLVIVLAPILVIGDAAIRHGRSRALAPTPAPQAEVLMPQVESVQVESQPAPPPVEPDAGVVVTPYDRPGI
jgi:hypothetical protein